MDGEVTVICTLDDDDDDHLSLSSSGGYSDVSPTAISDLK
jgi:hypothetical protein